MTHPLYETLGRNVREARRRQGLNQSALAERVGLSRASVANIEAGRQQVLAHILAKLGAALGTSPAELLGSYQQKTYQDNRLFRTALERAWVRSLLATPPLNGPA